MHRARGVLNELHFADGKEIIRQCPGGYVWNSELPTEVDADVFESILNEANAVEEDPEAQLALRMKAIELYKGDFLPEASADTWVVPITAYYRFLYVNAVNAVLEALAERNRWQDLVSAAQRAIAIDPYEERLYYYLILALASTDQVAAAKAQYDSLTDLLHREFGVTPSKDSTLPPRRLANSCAASRVGNAGRSPMRMWPSASEPCTYQALSCGSHCPLRPYVTQAERISARV